MPKIVATAMFVVTSLVLGGCGTWLDISRHLKKQEKTETVTILVLPTGDISEGYTLQPASGRPVVDHEKRRRHEKSTSRARTKDPNTIRESLPEVPAKDAANAPMKLVGLNIGETTQIFGPPDTTQNGQPSRVLQYDGTDCDIRLHFYFDLKTQRYRLLFYEASLLSGAQVVTQARDDVPAYCLRAFQERAVANSQ